MGNFLVEQTNGSILHCTFSFFQKFACCVHNALIVLTVLRLNYLIENTLVCLDFRHLVIIKISIRFANVWMNEWMNESMIILISHNTWHVNKCCGGQVSLKHQKKKKKILIIITRVRFTWHSFSHLHAFDIFGSYTKNTNSNTKHKHKHKKRMSAYI